MNFMEMNVAGFERANQYIHKICAGIDHNASDALSKMMRDDVDVKRGLRTPMEPV